MLSSILELIQEKQKVCAMDLISNINNWEEKQEKMGKQLYEDEQQNFSSKQNLALKQLQQEKSKKIEQKSIKKEFNANLNTGLKQKSQNSHSRIQNNSNTTNSPQLGKETQNNEHSQYQENSLPNPKLNLLKKQSQKLQKYFTEGIQKDFQNQFQCFNSDYVNQFSQNIQVQEHMKKLELEINQMSIRANKDENPQQMDIDSFHQRRKANISATTQINIKNSIKNSRVRKNSKNLLTSRNDIKTEINSNQHPLEKQQNSNGTSLYVEKEQLMQKSRVKIINNSIISNVVNYSQSFNQSNFYNSVSLPNRELKQLKKVNKSVNKKPYRYKTQEMPMTSKSRSKRLEDFQQFYQDEYEAKTQLKMVYEKKRKLHEKLRKLNKQLQKLNTEEDNKVQANLKDIKSPISFKTERKSNIYLVNRSNKQVSYSLGGYMSNLPSKKYQNQFENSKRAIEFVQRISKQSFQRKLTHKRIMSRQAFSRAKNQETFEGEMLHRNPFEERKHF